MSALKKQPTTFAQRSAARADAKARRLAARAERRAWLVAQTSARALPRPFAGRCICPADMDLPCLCRLPRYGRELLPIAAQLRPRPWQLQLPREHPEAHAILHDFRGWMEELPYIVTDLSLDDAEAIGWEGQA